MSSPRIDPRTGKYVGFKGTSLVFEDGSVLDLNEWSKWDSYLNRGIDAICVDRYSNIWVSFMDSCKIVIAELVTQDKTPFASNYKLHVVQFQEKLCLKKICFHTAIKEVAYDGNYLLHLFIDRSIELRLKISDGFILLACEYDLDEVTHLLSVFEKLTGINFSSSVVRLYIRGNVLSDLLGNVSYYPIGLHSGEPKCLLIDRTKKQVTLFSKEGKKELPADPALFKENDLFVDDFGVIYGTSYVDPSCKVFF